MKKGSKLFYACQGSSPDLSLHVMCKERRKHTNGNYVSYIYFGPHVNIFNMYLGHGKQTDLTPAQASNNKPYGFAWAAKLITLAENQPLFQN